ncbi:MAG: DUF937 domain-containing protein [Betaproteobacteria bacterium]|nr:DUF937 domain-containing protein [Betaproteobacteria bacterium]
MQQMGGGAAGQNPLLQVVMSLINNNQGGLQGLIEQSSKAGLGQQAQSWVSTGQNMPISAEQIMQVLGGQGGQLSQLTQQFGLSNEQAAGGLADLLPSVVDHLTPNGAIQNDVLSQGLEMLRGKLGG